MANAKQLLEQFPPVATEAWEEAIRKDLKGADYAKKLLWKTEDGIIVKPYYRAAELKELPYLNLAPGDFPYVRGTAPVKVWRIREDIHENTPKQANQRAQNALVAGAEEISFHIAVADRAALDTLLGGLEAVRVHFAAADQSLVSLLLQARKPALGSTSWSPFRDLKFATEAVEKSWTGFRPLTLDGSSLEEQGATTVQEVGYTLAAGIDFLNQMQQLGVPVDRAASAVVFSLGIGASYFFQISKFRAFRQLWAQAVTSFGGSRQAAKAEIHARTSRWNKTVYDAHVNALRGTTEAMSAAIGGADSISVAPFDATYKQPDDASRRLARNTQIILKKEAQLDRVVDPGGGSYYVEFLTDCIAREGWRLMQQIEAAGGYQKAVETGAIRSGLQKSRSAREAAVASRRRVFVGTNQYPNLTEKALDRLQANEDGNVVRGAHRFEEIRLRTEKHIAAGKSCRFLLAEIGDAKMRSARSSFAANFFGCAGFQIVTASGKSVGEIAAANADVIVLCSSDPEYPALSSALLSKLKEAGRATPVVIAGYPADSLEQLKQAGVADFIHIRSNAVETLTAWQQRLGMTS